MERRNHQEMGSSNPMVYAPPQLMIQESPPPPPLKLPLAPETHRRPTAVLPTRRGSSIFSPAHHHQTLDRRPYDPPPPPPRRPSPDPDPSTPTAAAPSKSKTPSPPPPPPPPAASSARYRECLKNHAASMGAHVVDGCGEFMPGGEDGTPGSLRCAACDCHRNFHRKESDGDPPPSNNPHPHRSRNLHGHRFASPAGMVSFGGAEESSSGHAASRKRFRTKFGQDQKDRMREFAEKVGWRIQKEDEEEVERFCAEVGVKRQVFKVWMHNNKQAMKKRSD